MFTLINNNLWLSISYANFILVQVAVFLFVTSPCCLDPVWPLNSAILSPRRNLHTNFAREAFIAKIISGAYSKDM